MDKHTPSINLENIRFSYPNGRLVLNGVDLKLGSGEKFGIIGPNGCGKSTLFQIIMGLLQPQQGTIQIFGNNCQTEKDFYTARQKVGLVFQNADDQLFSPTVLEDVAFGPLNMGKSPEEARQMARATLEDLHLQDFENRVTHRLSGGQKKLVSLATVLVMKPDVLLLDEPTNGLDEATEKLIVDIIQNLSASCLIVSHQFDFLSQTVDKVFAMHQGKIDYDQESKIHFHAHAHSVGNLKHEH